jgi:hypothetical protein
MYVKAGSALAFGFAAVFAFGCAGNTADDEGTSEDALTRLFPEEIVGKLLVGKTSKPIAYVSKPRYRALSFHGVKGRVADVWVRSSNGGDAHAWLLDKDFKVVGSNGNADATTKDAHITATLPATSTYYVAFREEKWKSATFTASLKTSAATTPTTTTTTLRMPILDENGELLSRFNPMLAKAKLAPIPDTFEVNAKNASDEFGRWYGYADEASAQINVSFSMQGYGIPADLETKSAATSICYRGDGALVGDMVANMADGPFSDQLSVWAWRYKNQTGMNDGLDPEFDKVEDFPGWTSYKTTSDTVLMWTATSDDGDERTPNEIPRCPN